MTRTLALLALVLTLLISACSQAPQDVQAPIAPQFGTAGNDRAVDVAVQKRLGHVYVAGFSSLERYSDQVFYANTRAAAASTGSASSPPVAARALELSRWT